MFPGALLSPQPLPMVFWLFQSANSTRYSIQIVMRIWMSLCQMVPPRPWMPLRAALLVIFALGFPPLWLFQLLVWQ